MTEQTATTTTDDEARDRPPVRVAILNDYDLVVDGLATMLAPFPDVQVVLAEAGEVELVDPVDVALFDTYGRHSVPWDELRALVAEAQIRHVALFTFSLGPELVRRAMAEGLTACLWKGMGREDLAKALRRVSDGEQVVSSPGSHGRVPPDGYRWPLAELRLTPRESEVLALLAEGMTNRAIAEAMGLGRETVKSHVREVFLKLGVHTRSEATNRVLRDPAFSHTPRQFPALRRASDAPASNGSEGGPASGPDEAAERHGAAERDEGAERSGAAPDTGRGDEDELAERQLARTGGDPWAGPDDAEAATG